MSSNGATIARSRCSLCAFPTVAGRAQDTRWNRAKLGCVRHPRTAARVVPCESLPQKSPLFASAAARQEVGRGE